MHFWSANIWLYCVACLDRKFRKLVKLDIFYNFLYWTDIKSIWTQMWWSFCCPLRVAEYRLLFEEFTFWGSSGRISQQVIYQSGFTLQWLHNHLKVLENIWQNIWNCDHYLGKQILLVCLWYFYTQQRDKVLLIKRSKGLDLQLPIHWGNYPEAFFPRLLNLVLLT